MKCVFILDYNSTEQYIEALKHEDETFRWRAADSLRHSGAEAVLPLIESLSDKSKMVRKSAAYSLGIIGDSLAVEPLIELLMDDSGKVRKEVIVALGKIGDLRAIIPLENLQEIETKQKNLHSIQIALSRLKS
jgi:HEAT repeat protein